MTTSFFVLAQSIPGDEGGAAPADGPSMIPGDAATTGADGSPTTGAPAGKPPSLLSSPFFMLIIVVMVFMIFSSMRAGKKDKRKRAEMMASLGKNAKVQTIGGVIGTVVELKKDEVVLKVDESGSTRIRFARTAIQQVLKPAKSGSETGDEIEEISIENG